MMRMQVIVFIAKTEDVAVVLSGLRMNVASLGQIKLKHVKGGHVKESLSCCIRRLRNFP